MADKVLGVCPPTAKSDGNDFVSLINLAHALPDELINSSDLGLPNGMDQLHTILGGGGMSVPLGCSAQDTAAKHKHLSELLRPGGPPSTSTVTSGPGNVPSLGMMGGLGGSTVAQGLGGPQQQSGMMPQPGLYISEDESSSPERFRGLGVRIEDDVVIQNHGGPLILSAHTPKTIAYVERACAQRED